MSNEPDLKERQINLIQTWSRNARLSAEVHYLECERSHLWSKRLGYGALISSIFVVIFSSNESIPALMAELLSILSDGSSSRIADEIRTKRDINFDVGKLLTIFAGACTVAISAFQQVKNHKELAWRHRISAAGFAYLHKKAELLLAKYPNGQTIPFLELRLIAKEYHLVSKSCPSIRRAAWKKVGKAKVKNENIAG